MFESVGAGNCHVFMASASNAKRWRFMGSFVSPIKSSLGLYLSDQTQRMSSDIKPNHIESIIESDPKQENPRKTQKEWNRLTGIVADCYPMASLSIQLGRRKLPRKYITEERID